MVKKNSLQGKIREFEILLKIREKSGNFKKSYLCKVKIFKFYSCSDVATGVNLHKCLNKIYYIIYGRLSNGHKLTPNDCFHAVFQIEIRPDMALIMLSVSFLNFLCTCFLSNVLFREYSITASVFCILACYMRNPFGHFNVFNGSAHTKPEWQNL